MLQWCESYLSACQCTLFRCCRSALFRLKAWLQKVHLNRLISEWTSHMWRFMLLRLWNSFPQTGHRKSASLNESNFPLCNGSPKEKKNNVWELYIFGKYVDLFVNWITWRNMLAIKNPYPREESIHLNQFSLGPKTQPIFHAIYWERKICSVPNTTLLFFLSVFYAH